MKLVDSAYDDFMSEQENEIKNKLTELFKRVLFHKDTYLVGHRYDWDGHSPIKEGDIKKTACFRTVVQRTSEFHGWNYRVEVKKFKEESWNSYGRPAHYDRERQSLSSGYFTSHGYDLSDYPELKDYFGNPFRDYCDVYSSDEEYCDKHELDLHIFNKTETFNELIVHFKEGEPPLKIKDGIRITFAEHEDIELTKKRFFFFKKKDKFTIYRRDYELVYYIEMGDKYASLTQEEYLKFFEMFREEFYKPIIEKANEEKIDVLERRLQDYE